MVDFFDRKLVENDLVLYKELSGSMSLVRYGIIKNFKNNLVVFDGKGCLNVVTVYKLANMLDNEIMLKKQLIEQYTLFLSELNKPLVVGQVYGTLRGKNYYLYLGNPHIFLTAKNTDKWVHQLVSKLCLKLDSYTGDWFYELTKAGYAEAENIKTQTMAELMYNGYIEYDGKRLYNITKEPLEQYTLSKFTLGKLRQMNRESISRFCGVMPVIVWDYLYINVVNDEGKLRIHQY